MLMVKFPKADIARKDSDIDVAVVIPKLNGDWLDTTSSLRAFTWSIIREISGDTTIVIPLIIRAGS